MTADQVRAFLKRNPFVPFTIHVADGRSFEVSHRDFVLLPPGWGTTLIVAQPQGAFDFVYLRQITSVSSDGEPPPLVQRRGEERSE